MNNMTIKKILPYLSWALGISLVVYVISQQPHFFINARKLPLQDIIGVAFFTICANACQGIRYFYLRPKTDIPFYKFMLLPFCMHSANIILPLRGGETVQPLFIQKWDASQKLKSLIYWLVVDKALEFLAMLPLVVAAAWAYSMHEKAALIIWLVAIFSTLVLWKKSKVRPRNLSMAYLFATLSWIFNICVFFSLCSSLKAALGLVVGTSIGGAIPGFPAAIGTYEYAFVWVSKQAGIASEQATFWAVASHSVSILITLLIGIPLGAAWGWPSEKEHIEAQPQITPLKHRISNVFVYILGILTVVASGTLWTPQLKRENKRQ